jgi:hypothetical protein
MNEAIVDESYLREHLQLSESFIARHSRSMGCFARKPRKFFLAQVMAHLEALAAEAQARAHGRKFQQAAQIREMRRFADKIISKNKRITDTTAGDFAAFFDRQYGEARR